MLLNHNVVALFGGLLIGLAATLLLLANGRVAGISGIMSGAFQSFRKENLWRWAFLAGLLTGGMILKLTRPDLLVNGSDRSVALVAAAGLLVGFGTAMGGGCTSGHGVCGISRLSRRSIVATLTFMFFAFVMVSIFGGRGS